jgi:hypothetical protein
MPLAHLSPVVVGAAVDGERGGRQVEQDVPPEADADGFEAVDPQMVDERPQVRGRLAVRETPGRAGRSPVPARGRDDQAAALRQRVEIEQMDPVAARPEEPVQLPNSGVA